MALDLGTLFVRIGSETGGLRRGEREVDRATKAMESDLKRTETAASRFWAVLGGTAALYGAIRFGKAIVDASVKMEAIENSLRAATGSAEGAAREFEFVRAEAGRLGLDLTTAGAAYAKLTAAARGTELQGQATRDIFSAVSEASTVLGLSAETTEGALRALEQMISKGNVQAEELRGQLGERIPGAFQIAARAMGVTTAELNKMLDNGEVLASELLPRMAQELRKTFGAEVQRAAGSTQAQINRFETAVFELLVQFGETGAIDAFTAALKAVTPVLVSIGELMNEDSLISKKLQREWIMLAQTVDNSAADIMAALRGLSRVQGEAVAGVAGMMAKAGNLGAALPGPMQGLFKGAQDLGVFDKLIQKRNELQAILEASEHREDQRQANRRERQQAELDDVNAQIAAMERQKTATEQTAQAETAAAAATEKSATAKEKKLAADQAAINAQRLQNDLLRLELEGQERLIPVRELEAKLAAEGTALLPEKRAELQALVDEEIALAEAIRQKNEAEDEAKRREEARLAQLEQEKAAVESLLTSQSEQLAVLYERLHGSEAEARVIETLNALQLESLELDEKQLETIRANLAAIEEYSAAIEHRSELEQQAAEWLGLITTEEEKRAATEGKLREMIQARLVTEEQALAIMRELSGEQDKLSDAFDSLASGIGDAFTGVVEGIITGSESAVDALAELGREIEKVILQALILEPLKAGITGGLGNLFTGGSFGAGFGEGFREHFKADTMAKGGIVDGATWVSPTQIAGERGAEAVLPLSRGPNGELGVRGSFDGGGSSVVINIIDQRQNGGEIQRSERRGPDGQRQIEFMIVDTVKKHWDRGTFDGVARRNHNMTRTGAGR